MSRIRNKLTTKRVAAAGPGEYDDWGGLSLRKSCKLAAQWIYRFQFNGKPENMGLGSFQKVSLKEARELRDKYEKLLVAGKHPRLERDRATKRSTSQLKTLQEVAESAFEALAATLRQGGKAGRWFSPLRLHVLPELGHLPVVEIAQHDIQRTLKPIWTS